MDKTLWAPNTVVPIQIIAGARGVVQGGGTS